jgi:hypothetical protein
LSSRRELQASGRFLPRVRSISKGSFAQRSILMPHRGIFLAVRANGCVNRMLRQFSGLGKIACVRLGVRRERKPKVLVLRFAREPLLLLSHGDRISQ